MIIIFDLYRQRTYVNIVSGTLNTTKSMNQVSRNILQQYDPFHTNTRQYLAVNLGKIKLETK